MDGGESRKPGKEEHGRNKVVDAVSFIEGGNKSHCGGVMKGIGNGLKWKARRTGLKMTLH